MLFRINVSKRTKNCFQHVMAYGDFKDFSRRTVSDKIMRDKALNIAKNSKYDGYQCGIAPMVYTSFDRKNCSRIENENMSDQQLVEELDKPIIRKF